MGEGASCAHTLSLCEDALSDQRDLNKVLTTQGQDLRKQTDTLEKQLVKAPPVPGWMIFAAGGLCGATSTQNAVVGASVCGASALGILFYDLFR